MDSPQNKEVEELNKALEHVEEGKDDEECTVCKFVLVFAFVVLLLVMVFTFIFRLKPQAANTPLAPELAPPFDPVRQNQQILELGKVLHPELSSASNTVQQESTGGIPPPPAPPPSNK